ncbi:MAG TPA: hypothetical protein VKZ88_04920 [Fibrobacteria bacterium]|nr:hypothetical protein [Fibrobacteria bacterium]
MAFSEEEKDLVVQSLQFYLQQAGAQLPPQAMQQLMTMAKGIVSKLDQPGAGAPQAGEPPAGISREWFDNVCVTCDQLTATGCADKITAKFPGKCDPILIYERGKTAVV